MYANLNEDFASVLLQHHGTMHSWMTKGRILLFLAATTLFGILVNGYHFGIWDHAVYIPMMQKSVDPSLFPNDYMFDDSSGLRWFYQRNNITVPIVSALNRFFPLDSILFVFFLMSQLAFLCSIYGVSLALFRSDGIAALSVLFLVIPRWMGGTTNLTQDTYFTFRGTAMPIAMAFLIPYFRGQLTLAAILCGVTFLLHPTTAVPIICLLLFRYLIDGFRRGWLAPAKGFGVLLLFILPQVFRVYFGSHTQSADRHFFCTPDWAEILRQRFPSLFMSAWSWDSYLSMGAYLVTLICILILRGNISWRGFIRFSNAQVADLEAGKNRSGSSESDFWVAATILVCAGLFVAGFIFVEWFPVPMFHQLQVQRCFYLVINLSMIYAAWLIWEGFNSQSHSIPVTALKSTLSQVRTMVRPGLLVLVAVFFVSDSTDKMVLGTAAIVAWSIGFELEPRDASYARLRPTWVWIASGLGTLLILACFQEALFSHGLIKALHLRYVGLMLATFVVIELSSRLIKNGRWARSRGLATNALLISTCVGLVVLNWDRLHSTFTGTHFAERVQLPNRPLHTNETIHGKEPVNDFIDLGQWSHVHIAMDAIFFVPPDTLGFRIYSQHGIVGDWYDGNMATFSKSFALSWWERMKDLEGYDAFEEAKFNELKQKYKASYAVTRKSQRLQFPVVYRNGSFVVYQL